MKRVITLSSGILFLFMFLVYSGVFRDSKNPQEIVRYYFACLKNREGFLTYPISTSVFFNDDKFGELYKKYKLYKVIDIKLRLREIKDNAAFVESSLVYNDKQTNQLIVELKNSGARWLVNKIN